MTDQTALTLTSERSNRLWSAINRIPDNVLTDYLADNIIDESEIEDIAGRIQSHLRYAIDEQEHQLIRQMVRQAVAHIQREHELGGEMEGQLCRSTLGDIRSVMGELISSGQIALNVTDICKSGELSPNEAIPDERPEDYDETAENPL